MENIYDSKMDFESWFKYQDKRDCPIGDAAKKIKYENISIDKLKEKYPKYRPIVKRGMKEYNFLGSNKGKYHSDMSKIHYTLKKFIAKYSLDNPIKNENDLLIYNALLKCELDLYHITTCLIRFE